MIVLRWLGQIERILCASGFVIMSLALVLDVGARLFLGHGIVGAPQIGLVGMLVTALFGVGITADAGEHFRPRVLDKYVPTRYENLMQSVGHFITAIFFTVLCILALQVSLESRALEDVTSLLRWPIWVLQMVLVIAFGLNVVRFVLFAILPNARPDEAGVVEVGGVE